MIKKLLGKIFKKKQEKSEEQLRRDAKDYFGEQDFYKMEKRQHKSNMDLLKHLYKNGFDGSVSSKVYLRLNNKPAFVKYRNLIMDLGCGAETKKKKLDIRTELTNIFSNRDYRNLLEEHIKTAIRENVKKDSDFSDLLSQNWGNFRQASDCKQKVDEIIGTDNQGDGAGKYLNGLTSFNVNDIDIDFDPESGYFTLPFTIDFSISCVYENSKIKMANGKEKMAKEISKGDMVKTNKGKSKVRCVLKTKLIENKGYFIELDSGLLITPWHPVRINGEWVFPVHNSSKFVMKKSEAVYSFLLENDHVLLIDGTEVCGLAHNFKGNVIEHEYYGTNKVVEDLQKMDGWDNGLVELQQGKCIIRDDKTNNVAGLYQVTQNKKDLLL
jgi:hypothetical protein